MQLRRVSVNGFKTFAGKSDFEFKSGITAVVGPNGSGKSNLSDAIRWALGEQSARLLRGSSMSDVIFAGTTAKKPSSMAEVTVLIDNSDRALSLDFDEVAVTRRVFRDGESQFLMNGVECRLKDISELFAGTGLGKEAYAAIEQGKVDAIISSQPQDRRGIFDEASGIMRYKLRKRDAERKLTDVDERTARAEDVLAEISQKEPVLEKQAKDAQDYKSAAAEMKSLEFALMCRETAEAGKRLAEYEVKLAKRSADRQQLESELSVLEAGYEQMRVKSAEIGIGYEKAYATAQALITSAQKHEMAAVELEAQSSNLKELNSRAYQDSLQLKKEEDESSEKLERLNEEIASAENEMAEAAIEAGERESTLHRLETEIAQIEASLENVRSEHFAQASEVSSIRNLISSNQDRAASLRIRISRLQQAVETRMREGAEISAMLSEHEKKARSISDELTFAVSQRAKQDAELNRLRGDLKDREAERDRSLSEQARSEAVLAGLLGMDEEHEGYPSSVRSLLAASKEGTLKGIIGAAGDCIRVPEGLEAAIESALGFQAADIICERARDAEEAIAFLKAASKGRCTFLPLDLVKPNRIRPDERLRQAPGFLGIAYDMVEFDAKLRSAYEYLLGNTAVFTDLKAAILAQESGLRLRMVTRDGEALAAAGAITGGSRRSDGSSAISRKAKMNSMQREIAQRTEIIDALKSQIRKLNISISTEVEKNLNLEKSIASLEEELRTIKAEISKKNSSIDMMSQQEEADSGEIAEMSLQCSAHDADIISLKSDLIRAEEALASHGGEDLSLKDRRQSLMSEASSISEQRTKSLIRKASAEAVIRGLRDALRSAEDSVKYARRKIEGLVAESASANERSEKLAKEAASERKLAEQFSEQARAAALEANSLKSARESTDGEAMSFEQDAKAKRRKLNQAMDHESAIAMEKAKISGEFSVLASRLEKEHGITPAQAESSVPDEIDVDSSIQRTGLLKSIMESLGDVNLAAPEELASVRERISFMKGQIEDLSRARASLSQVIREAERTAGKQFSEMFELIRQNFKEIFSRLFDGGIADIVLTDDEEPLESGIEIICRPPGKKLSQLSLLSGGEKALAAIALIFSFLKARPAPFCMLDEIDAALDDANVDRFRELVSEYSSDSQMIIITHRRRTMETADRVYGVTMEENGVSKAVCIDTSELIFQEGLVE